MGCWRPQPACSRDLPLPIQSATGQRPGRQWQDRLCDQVMQFCLEPAQLLTHTTCFQAQQPTLQRMLSQQATNFALCRWKEAGLDCLEVVKGSVKSSVKQASESTVQVSISLIRFGKHVLSVAIASKACERQHAHVWRSVAAGPGGVDYAPIRRRGSALCSHWCIKCQ